MNEKIQSAHLLITMSVVGILVAAGQLLSSTEPITWRSAFGRALTCIPLALMSGIIFIQFPELPLEVIVGLSAFLASMGTSTLERIVNNFLGGKK